MFDDPFFRQFFDDQTPDSPRERTRREQSLGSGAIISPDGYILTANHVVADADEIKVAIGDDKKEFTARLIGRDQPTDVAVLKIDATDLPAITLGDSDQLEVGDVVLAIGDPLELGRSVTMGIVSGLGRHYGVNGVHGYEDFIQTDAAINEGNSGGPLVDAEGRLVGINTWIATQSGGNEGIGFAVPVNLARNVMERLISGGKVSRGFLGVAGLQDITPELAQQFNLPSQNGVLVNDVQPNSPAAKAGIKPDDVIVAFNGKDVADKHSLQLAFSESAPGTDATVKLIRDGAVKNISVALGEVPGENAQNGGSPNQSDNEKTDGLDGVTVDDLNSDARQELRIPDSIHGAIVTGVNADSNAADAGMRRNDVIVSINRQPVNGSDEAIRLCKAARGDQILVKVWGREAGFAGTRYISVDNTKRQKK
jgi:serine protease Do